MAGEGTYVVVVLEGNINLNVFYKVVRRSHAPTLLCCWREKVETWDILCINEAATQCLTEYQLNLPEFKQILYDNLSSCSTDIKPNEVKWQRTFTAYLESFTLEANIIFRSEEEIYFLLNIEEKIEEIEVEKIEYDELDGDSKLNIGVAKPKRLPCYWNSLSSIIEDKYKVIVENSYDIICLTDKEGNYLLASHSYLPVLGYDPLKLTGQSVLSYIHPNDHKRIQETLIKMVETKEESEAVVYRKMHANGHYKYFEGKGMPILSSSGEVVSFVVISRDITDMKNRDDLLIRSEKLALAGELAAGIAHEIKNPLTTLKGFFQLTESQLEPYRDVLMHELNQINNIIEELLLVARPRAIKEEKVDLLNVIRDSLTSIDTEIQLKNITIDLQLCDEAYLFCAPHQLTQVFINLLKNAVEAMDNEGNLSIKVKKVDQTIHIIVKDTGIGMTQEDLARLGEPYYSISSKGTGIGLMVCYKVIENHGGSMSITSVCEEGTEVSIQLPGLQTMSLN
nr:ATP-binding protein [Alkalihalophilus marmarensis]